jgi:LmbE family N-acetylglucosaminyl deacetylase
MNTVVVIAPHPDDESIGCGGTLAKHVALGVRVVVAYLTSGELGLKQIPREEAWKVREAEARKAARALGLKATYFLRGPDWMIGDHVEKVAADLRPILAKEAPELIYLPHPQEWHPDHKAALPILREALQDRPPPLPAIRGYEVWTPLSAFDHVEDISLAMPRKLRAIRAHHSQLNDLAYDRAIRGLNEYRGALSGRCKYAEVFQEIHLSSGQ